MMRYWWVNQNQTLTHEISGSYMWSPKYNRDGGRNTFYSNMRRVDTGDIVFSFAKQMIGYLGIVQRPAISAQKPSDFGLVGDYWNDEGWFAAVEWHKAVRGVRPKDIIADLRPHLPQKYSPLRATGDGLQNVYLAEVPTPMADALLAHFGAWGREITGLAKGIGTDDGALRDIEDVIERSIRNNTDIDETERQAVVNSRRGQGRYRKNLEQIEKSCRITGIADPRLLRASHIKPWRSCISNHERLDGNNGLFLSYHVDHLFDRGYISFTNNGELLLSSRLDIADVVRLGIRMPVNVGSFNEDQKTYLSYHRENVFLS